jgi:predicted CopG family antitoxin
MRKKLTITIDEEVYEGLRKVVGPRHISSFLEALARPHVVMGDLDEGYAAMAADSAREAEALAWIEAAAGDALDPEGCPHEKG